MKENFNQKTEIEELACKILNSILDYSTHPMYLTEYHKKASEYEDKLEKQFEKDLSKEQKHNLDCILSIKNVICSSHCDYSLLYGMQIKTPLDEIIKNPLKILELYHSNSTDVSELYKFTEENGAGNHEQK